MFQLSEEAQRFLLRLARQTVSDFLQSGNRPLVEDPPEEVLPKRGAFVTLHKNKMLRGCIGYVVPLYPLHQAVTECAIAAATEDPRFPVMEPEELPEIHIEISILSPVTEVKDINEIQVGIHGLVISHKGRRGLLLPQVPLEQEWNRERFLQETCRKAGLPPGAWKSGARIESFTAFVFAEERIERDSN
jgi:AmmeMemoRadiSam system protein A